MKSIKQALLPFTPGNWNQFALGIGCLLAGIMNLVSGSWYDLMLAAFALFTAGFIVAGSIMGPLIKHLTEELEKVNYDKMGENAAKSFKAHVLQMHARGEFPPGIQIVIGDDPSLDPRRPQRLN
jgi:hypothetical protein